MTLRSSIYLAGNKYKLFDTIKPHLQDGKRKHFVDVFGGSGTVTLNTVHESIFDTYTWNDKARYLFNLQEWVQSFDDNSADIVETLNGDFESTKDGYLKLRVSYNDSLDSTALLYLLMCRSNSNMTRFNNSGGFNVPYGERNRCSVGRIWRHHNNIQDVKLRNEDFGDFLEDYVEKEDLSKYTFYLDAPYHLTTATYNENGGWTQNDNTTLLEYCLELQKKGAKVVISNVFENRGNTHQELIDWCEENKETFTVHHLNISYNNSSFRKGKGKTDEVLIVSK